DHSLVLKEGLITNEIQHDLEEKGIAKTAREEKLRAARERLKQEQENERMAKLYRQHILNEPVPEVPKIVQLLNKYGIEPQKDAPSQ
ncbi:MAG TPA: radical SAM protein, partial [Nitrospirota bacterium]